MAKSTNSGIKLIQAAGGLLWRDSDNGRQILIVHRQRYDDWTLPKGKLDAGESWEEAAVREVEEETGCKATIDRFAGIISYAHDDRPKVVLFFHMVPQGECKEIQMETGMEVDALQWVTILEAMHLLNYEAERQLLRMEPES